MAISNFSTLKSAVADWLDRGDMGDAIETMIGLAEARIYRELRIRAMESALAVTISSGTAAVPSDYLELKYAYLNTNPTTPLEVRSAQWIFDNYPTRASDSVPAFISRVGSLFVFGPYPDSDYVLAGAYYAKLAALSTSNETNWFTTHAPDLLLYGTLVHSAPYIGHDSRVTLWEAAFQQAFARVREQDDQERYPRSMNLRAMHQ